MAALSNYTIAGYSCDARGCKAEIRGEYMPWSAGCDYYRLIGRQQGWTFWSSRGLRSYCGNHKPKPGHRMTRIEVR